MKLRVKPVHKPLIRAAVLAVALVGTAWLAVHAPALEDDAQPAVDAVDRAPRSAQERRPADARGSEAAEKAAEILELRPRTMTAETRALFASISWAPPARPAAPPPPPPPPTAPALPFSFVGKRHDGTAWEVFVNRGEQTIILREAQVIDGQYRIDSIKPPLMTVTYLPLDEKQSLAIGAAE